jgi:repressor LexA
VIRTERPGQLTQKQHSILLAARTLTERLGYPPSMTEVLAEARCKSRGGLSYQYKQLEAKGYLRRTPGQPRTLEVRLPGETCFPSESARHSAQNGDDLPSAGPAGPAGPAGTAGSADPRAVAWVPEVGEVPAGPYGLAEQSILRYVPLPAEMAGRDGGAFVLKVTGDSMTGAGILPGDWIVVRPLPPGSPPRNGDIVVAIENTIEPEATVKTYQKVGRQVWLVPQNPDYLPIPGNGVGFAGKVVAVLRQVTPKRTARS